MQIEPVIRIVMTLTEEEYQLIAEALHFTSTITNNDKMRDMYDVWIVDEEEEEDD